MKMKLIIKVPLRCDLDKLHAGDNTINCLLGGRSNDVMRVTSSIP
jgi:hypothetical protein